MATIKNSEIFITGCARSGTTAVTKFLNRSQFFAIGIERYQNYWNLNSSLPDNAFSSERFFNIQENDSWYKSLPAHYEELNKKWGLARFIGDKVPGYYRNIPWLLKKYPTAKFIHCYRDPFSVARSFKERATNENDNHWGPHRDVTMAITQWNESIKNVIDFYKSVGPEVFHERYYILEYEKFICNGIDRREFSHFFKINFELQSNVFKRSNKSLVLTEAEIALVWSLLDLTLIDAIKSIISEQHFFIGNKIDSLQSGKSNGYHIEDKLQGISYGDYYIPDCRYTFRGRNSEVNLKSSYAACIGSATTFGRFLKNPYPNKLENAYQIPFINLGLSGARPETYLMNSGLMNFLKDSKFILFELMSARGYPSPIFCPIDYSTNHGHFMDYFDLKKHRRSERKLDWLLKESEEGRTVFVDRVYEICFAYLDFEQRNIVRDIIVDQYIRDIKKLVSEIKRPMCGLLITRNEFFYARKNRVPLNSNEWLGDYPHFIDEAVVSLIEQLGIPVIKARGKRGFPSRVMNEITQMPAQIFTWQDDPSINNYYPSQEMIDDAVTAMCKSQYINNLIDS